MLNVENVKIKFSEHFSSAATLERNIQILNLLTVLNVANLRRMKQDSKFIPDSLARAKCQCSKVNTVIAIAIDIRVSNKAS